MERSDSDEIIASIKEGDPLPLQKVYSDHREAFLHYAVGFGLDEEDAKDIYQESILVFRDNIYKGHLKKLSCSVKTYLFSIGKNKIREHLRKEKRSRDVKNVLIEETDEVLYVNLFEEEPSIRELQLQKVFLKLGDRCKEILKLSFLQGYSLDEITEILDYSSKNVLKSQKSRCLKQLKDLIL
ncbi:RNA polymerase sigma factor [Namhaeicola litoreus]|uniref:RNA polymerase sigma factor n=1 Tax=Namhaeicola litoreus TaxID=1052145 RepID=A0ABW3Y1P5_9FLAO